MEERIQTYQEFWPYYLREHSDRTNRTIHVIGTALVFFILAGSVMTQNWVMLYLMPIAGYGFAWFGHFVFEKNRPATFKYPFWSLISDFKMFGHFLSGTLNRELKQAGVNC